MLRFHTVNRFVSFTRPKIANLSLGRRTLSAFEKFPDKVGLYNKQLEKDSCGVGLVANLKKIASREIVVNANQMLVRMSHRGGCGCEPNSGDGAGILLGIPHQYYSKVVKEELGKSLGEPNSYGTGIIFSLKSDEHVNAIKEIFQSNAERLGFDIIGWRTLKTGLFLHFCSNWHNLVLTIDVFNFHTCR